VTPVVAACMPSLVDAHAIARHVRCYFVAGAEALFADLGHFNRHAMQLSTLCLVRVALPAPTQPISPTCAVL